MKVEQEVGARDTPQQILEEGGKKVDIATHNGTARRSDIKSSGKFAIFRRLKIEGGGETGNFRKN